MGKESIKISAVSTFGYDVVVWTRPAMLSPRANRIPKIFVSLSSPQISRGSQELGNSIPEKDILRLTKFPSFSWRGE